MTHFIIYIYIYMCIIPLSFALDILSLGTLYLLYFSLVEFSQSARSCNTIHPSMSFISVLNSFSSSSQSQSFFKMSINVLGYLPLFRMTFVGFYKVRCALFRRCALCNDLLVATFFDLSSQISLAFQLCVLVTFSFHDIFVVILSNLV